MVEVVMEAKHRFLLWITITPNILQELNLIKRLIHIILIIGNNLHTVTLPILQTKHLHRLRELRLPQHRHNLIPTRNHLINDYLEVLVVFEPGLILVEDDFQVVAVVDGSVVFDWVELVLGGGEF
jgi:hypothetical protein